MNAPKIKKFMLSQLTAAEYNPRVIDESALEGLAHSISRFGCVEPIVVNVKGGANTIVGGHQRLRALEQLGVKDVICVTVSCSKADEKLLNLTLNNPAIQGQFIEDIGEYIEKLRADLGDDKEYLALRIDKMRDDIFNDIDEANMPDLPDSDRVPFQQMTFTLHDSQVEIVKKAIEKAKKTGPFKNSPNENSNGNALARIARGYIGKS